MKLPFPVRHVEPRRSSRPRYGYARAVWFDLLGFRWKQRPYWWRREGATNV